MQDVIADLKKTGGDNLTVRKHDAAASEKAMFSQAGADGHVAKLGISEGFLGADRPGWEREAKKPGFASYDKETPLHMKAGPVLGDDNDRQWLEEINFARSQPRQYAAYVKTLEHEFKAEVWKIPGRTPLRTREGFAALQELISFLEAQSSLPPLTLHDSLSAAASELTVDAGKNGHMEHDLSNGDDIETRLGRYGEAVDALSEVCCYGWGDAKRGVVALLADDGDETRNNRTTIFGDEYKLIGLNIGAHATANYTGTFILAGGWEDPQ